MRRTELNEIIRDKIASMDESPQMKAFLLDILEFERQNLHAARPQYSKVYLARATDYSKKEGGERDVDI